MVFQFQVMAVDNGVPPKNRTTNVVIRFRVDKPPQIFNLPRTVKVSENAENGTVVYTARASDEDRQVGKGR